MRQAAHEPPSEPAPRRAVPSFREFVEGEWRDVHFRRYKPSTRKGIRSLLASRLMSEFGPSSLDRITPARVRRWFDAFSPTAPVNANCGLDVLRQIMNFAIARGHVDANPAVGIAPNRRPKLTRFLSREEIVRLHRALDGQDGKGNRQQADMIRLLLLTGCRRARSCGSDGPRSGMTRSCWPTARRGQERCPSIPRHGASSNASHAVMNGVPVPVVSRMLGHSNVRMTLRYAHLGDREIEAATERVGQAIWVIVEI